jgi:hypothetical protein
MHTLNHEELRALLQDTSAWCLSLYLPTHRTGPEMRQDPIRFKNLLRQAEDQLLALGLAEDATRKALRPLQELLSREAFWQQQTEGLAVFLNAETFRYYHLPLDVPELTVVTQRFHLKPLLRILSGAGHYYLLTLSQKQVKLFEGTRYDLQELTPPGMPTNIAEALGEEAAQPQVQAHTSGQRGVVMHGHGEASAETKDRLLRFFRQLNAHLREQLANSQAPLVLAGVEYLLPIYREVNTYAHLLAEGLRGNPEHISREELLQQAWTLVHPHHLREREKAEAQYRQLLGTGRATNRVAEALSGATQGRVATLFVPVGVHRWGSFDAYEQKLETHAEPQPGDEDLLDLAALQTLAHGGTVYAVKPEQMPDHTQAAAILRY